MVHPITPARANPRGTRSESDLALSASHGSQQPVVLMMQPAEHATMYEEFLRQHDLVLRCPSDALAALTLTAGADVIVTGLLLPGAMAGLGLFRAGGADVEQNKRPFSGAEWWASPGDRRRGGEG